MKNFINDIKNFYKLYKINKKYNYCFFVENNFILDFLKPYIEKKNKKNCLVVSFEEISIELKYQKITFKTFFFQSLFFLSHKFSFFVTSTPDLDNNFFYKKSINIKCKYIYIQHSPVSLVKIYNNGAFSNFNLVQAVNLFQEKEIKKINKIFNKKIRSFRSSYFPITKIPYIKNIEPKELNVLIAPTWSTNFYQMGLHKKISKILETNKIKFTFRPHYMSIKNKEVNLSDIKNLDINFTRKIDFEFKEYSHLISDWSGVFIEFAFIKKNFPILINNKQKIKNLDDKIQNHEIIEVYARNKIAHVLEIKELEKITSILRSDFSNENSITIENFQKNFFF